MCVTPPPCRHCGKNRATRPRQLCYPCYYAPGVRQRYSAVGGGKYTTYGHGLAQRERPLPAEPTQEWPGSPGKLAVLQARAAAETQLWHPDDKQLPGDEEGRPRLEPDADDWLPTWAA